MGKRKGAKRSGVKSCAVKLLPRTRNELTQIVDELFQKCCSAANISGQSTRTPFEEWDEYMQLYELVKKIQEIEKEILLPTYARKEQIEPFKEWLESNKILLDGVEIWDFEEEGYGLKCTKGITEADLVIKVPNSIIMSVNTAKKTFLGPLMKKDPILQQMGNVALALHVLGEYVDPRSFWQPYLRMLPSEFSTCIYFAPEQVILLKGSAMLDEALKQFRNVARQYSYFYRIFHELPEAKSWPIRDYFTFDAYRWAVSVVMTRLNRIPSKRSVCELALIPAWDMANHEHGVFSTDYNEETSDINCFAHRSFEAEEQFKIYYGKRTNTEFLLHSGFALDDNPNNVLPLKMGVSKSDSLYSLRASLLGICSIPTNGTFILVPGLDPITPDLFAFMRIFCMDEGSLQQWSKSGNANYILKDEICRVISNELEIASYRFLQTRIALLMKAYPTLLQDDEEILLQSSSGVEALIRKCLLAEKKILKDTTRFISETLLTFDVASDDETVVRCYL